jgi:hypothetical protein
MSLESRVDELIQRGREDGRREHNAIRANLEAEKDEPTAEWGRVEGLSLESDLVSMRLGGHERMFPRGESAY